VGVKLRNDINKRALETAALAEGAGHDVAELVAERARDRVPVDSGDLKGTIRAEGDEAKVGGGDVDYAKFVDMGTVFTSPTHFWSTSVADGGEEFKQHTKEALRTASRRSRK
jgi:hypothetical protein